MYKLVSHVKRFPRYLNFMGVLFMFELSTIIPSKILIARSVIKHLDLSKLQRNKLH